MHDNSTLCDWKQCETCNIARPFRAKHCPEPGCNRCISRFDHYCGFIGAPVGAGNEVSFMLFCLFAFVDVFLAFLNGAWVLLAPSGSHAAAPGLLSILRAGSILSMATVDLLWQRAFVVRSFTSLITVHFLSCVPLCILFATGLRACDHCVIYGTAICHVLQYCPQCSVKLDHL
jgi:hypothetical protein